VTIFGRNDTRSYRCVPDETDVTDEAGPARSQAGPARSEAGPARSEAGLLPAEAVTSALKDR
jgi:hypothetical protein